MKLETFFEKFDQFADAPNAIEKMRGLVLVWAVQGRLVSQNSEDETAHAMLDRVISNSKSRGRAPNELDAADVPFRIPESWAWVRLPRVLMKLTDGTHHSPPNGPSGDVKYVTAKNIKTGGVLLDGITYVTKKVHEEIYSRCDPSPGDVLYIKDGATTGIACINQLDEPFSMLSSVALLKPSCAIFNRYLLWAMRSPFFYEETRGAMKGAAITRVTLSVMAESVLPLPPLAEQKRIVAKVGELMALCDRLEAQQQERETRHAALTSASLARFADAPTPASLELLFHKSYTVEPTDLRKCIHTLAVQGKLVPQDPNDEPAGESLLRLGLKSTLVSKKDGVDDKDLPLSWARVRFDDVALIAGGVALGRKLGDRKTVTLPYLRVANVKRGKINLTVVKELLIAEDEIERYSLRQNDLLMTEGGDWDKVGRAAIWIGEIPVCLHQNHVFRARMRSVEINPHWFERYFNSPIGRSYFETASKQTTNLASINMRQVRGCPIPFPPIAEQRRIVAKVDQMMALVDQLETQLAASRATAANLMEAVVGELIDQGLNSAETLAAV